jgi:Spy/CpxP family protein refolding chaperone
MTRAKIAFYLSLIFLAGAIAGGAVVLSTPKTFGLSSPPKRPGNHEDFANFIWNQMKDRLKLTEAQAAQVEPVFRKGFSEVRDIQERSLQEVEAAIRKNHEEIEVHLTPEQRVELQKMDQERQNFFIKRREKSAGPTPQK